MFPNTNMSLFDAFVIKLFYSLPDSHLTQLTIEYTAHWKYATGCKLEYKPAISFRAGASFQYHLSHCSAKSFHFAIHLLCELGFPVCERMYIKCQSFS